MASREPSSTATSRRSRTVCRRMETAAPRTVRPASRAGMRTATRDTAGYPSYSPPGSAGASSSADTGSGSGSAPPAASCPCTSAMSQSAA